MKKTKLFLTLVLALSLCFGVLATTAFAADPPKSEGTPANPAKAAITKHLKVPVGTLIPADFKFTFSVTPISVDEVPAATAGNMPAISNVVVQINPGIAAGATDIIDIYAQSSDIFAGFAGATPTKEWPHAGVYEYLVVETTADIDTVHEILDCSGAEYILRVYVLEDDKNPGNYYAAIITAERIKDDDGEEIEDGEKVDPTPNAPGGTGLSKMTFLNKYVHTNGTDTPGTPDPTDPKEATMTVSKTVSGEYASTSVSFNFAMTIFEPAIDTDPALPGTYNAYIVGTSNTVVGSPISFETGKQSTFSLKHGEKLVFVNTPVGTRYNVSEEGTPAYQATLDITSNNTPDAGNTFGKNPDNTLGAGIGVTGKYVGEALNLAAFTNIRDAVTPTGLNLNDLPFIGMILLAVGAVALLVMAKARKKSYNK